MKIRHVIFILGVTLFVNLPLLANPQLFLERGNDLQEQFWPIINFVKNSILADHIIPFWNPIFLSGAPLLPDPQSPLFYLPNILFLLFNIDTAFIISILTHNFWGGLGMYFVSKKIFKFTDLSSLIASAMYIASPTVASFLEAGHFGLIQAYSWIPWCIYFSLPLTTRKQSVLLSLSLAAIFLTHLPTFLITAGVVLLIGLKNWKLLILSTVLCIGVISTVLLPQLEWQPFTTRSILLQNPDIYPKWTSIAEFIIAMLIPLKSTLATEKIISIGVLPAILGVLGYSSLSKKMKIAVLTLGIAALLLTLGTLSPIYPLLIKIPIYALLRVSSRFFLPLMFIIIFLSGLALDKIITGKLFIAILVMVELIAISWSVLSKPTTLPAFAPKQVYEFLRLDTDKFRVFCTNRCLSQKYASIYNLELVDGYTTLPQKNIYQYGWEITNNYWNYYTLSIPPMGIYLIEKLHPDPKHLGLINAKYIISPYEIDDSDLIETKRIGDFIIYRNNLYVSRVTGGEILSHTPNKIDIKVNQNSDRIILSEVYSPGWKAIANGEEIPISASPLIFRSVQVPSGVTEVTFEYSPVSFKIGSAISVITLLISALLLTR